MKKPKNYLTDLNKKFKFKIKIIGLGGEEFKRRRLTEVRLIVEKPKTRKRHPLLKSPLDLKSLAKVRQTPFRLQYTINRYYLARQYFRRGVKNPIDEFAEVKAVTRTHQDGKLAFLVDVCIIDNMQVVKMMNSLHKTITKKRKPTKKKSIKRRKRRK